MLVQGKREQSEVKEKETQKPGGSLKSGGHVPSLCYAISTTANAGDILKKQKIQVAENRKT